MELKLVVAIVRSAVLETVEERLRQHGVKGISVSLVRGYGEYANLYRTDRMVGNAKIEIFTAQANVDEVVAVIMETAHQGIAGDGLVAVLPVEKLYRIRTKAEIELDEC